MDYAHDKLQLFIKRALNIWDKSSKKYIHVVVMANPSETRIENRTDC